MLYRTDGQSNMSRSPRSFKFHPMQGWPTWRMAWARRRGCWLGSQSTHRQWSSSTDTYRTTPRTASKSSGEGLKKTKEFCFVSLVVCEILDKCFFAVGTSSMDQIEDNQPYCRPYPLTHSFTYLLEPISFEVTLVFVHVYRCSYIYAFV